VCTNIIFPFTLTNEGTSNNLFFLSFPPIVRRSMYLLSASNTWEFLSNRSSKSMIFILFCNYIFNFQSFPMQECNVWLTLKYLARLFFFFYSSCPIMDSSTFLRPAFGSNVEHRQLHSRLIEVRYFLWRFPVRNWTERGITLCNGH
jgi:hypothetical protein